MSRPTLAVVVWCMIMAAASAACVRSPRLDLQATDTLRPPTSTSMRTPTSTQTSAPSLTPTQTPTPHDVPPVIVFDAPSESLVGEQVVLDASNSFDFDGDPITFAWSQFQNPDRYTGSEYVTANEVSLESADSATAIFVAQWPGRYRFVVSATDDDGETVAIHDVDVYPTEDIFAIRGMAIDGHSGGWSEEQANALLSYLRALGFNYIQVGIHDTVDSAAGNEILIDRCRENWTLTLDQNMTLVDLAHEWGLSVMLSPHLACTVDGEWIESYNVRPTDRALWFQSYIDYAYFYARLAQEHHVEILNLGGGMYQFHGFAAEWSELLDGVREVYDGRVAYSWFDFPPWPERGPRFPHPEKLDIMVNAFNWNGTGISLTGDLRGHNDPSIPEMMRYFNVELSRYLDGLQARYGKSMIATDIFPWPVDGMNVSPVALYFTEQDFQIDNQEPIDYAEAAFITMAERGWEGLFFWSLGIGPPPNWVSPETRGLPIEQMLEIWFTSESFSQR